MRKEKIMAIQRRRMLTAALGGALCGYIVLGKEFIRLWLGDGYSFAWIVGLLLMVPTTIPLVQNVCLSILRAQNKMLWDFPPRLAKPWQIRLRSPIDIPLCVAKCFARPVHS